MTREPKTPTGRKPGGQAGHKRHTRELLAPDKVRSVTDCKPERCAGCNHRLGGEDPEPHRHQVAELPKFEPLVDEFRLHTLASAARCRASVLPEGTATGAFGPTIVATITLLLGAYGLSRRDVAELMRDLFGLPISVGGVVGCQKIGADALAAPHAQFSAIPARRVKYADETGWKLGHVYACLWVVVTARVTLFRIQAERSRAAAMKVLGTVRGLLGSDRYAAYDHWPTHMHQFCWAHLSRLFVRFSERRDPQVAAIGHALIVQKDQMFEWWHRVRDGTLARSTFQRHMRPVQRRVAELLEQATSCSCLKTQRTCVRLLQNVHALWTFVYRHEGIEASNNTTGERAIRRAVIIRKTSFGSPSDHGCRFLERVLTVHATLRQRSATASTTSSLTACRAHMLGAQAAVAARRVTVPPE